MLVPHRHGGVASDLRHHVSADFFHLAIELVAQCVRPGQTGPDFGAIPRFEQRYQPLVLLTQIAAEVVVHRLDPIVDPAKPGIVGLGGRILDDGIDQTPRGLRFLINFQAFRLVDLLTIGKANIIRRRLHLRDHHPANRQPLLQRTDVHPRQMTVGFDIFRGEFVKLVGNLARHHCRQERRYRHQDDQPQSDPKDSFPDGRSQHAN